MIDLRSDTVHKPTPAMRQAMLEAEVGDDVYGEDPTVNRLEQRAAEIIGKEAALFVPSGTMGNTIGIKLHTEPGQEVICDSRAHVLDYELAMMAWFSGCVARHSHRRRHSQLGRGRRANPAAGPALGAHRRDRNRKHAQHGGGTVYPVRTIREICEGAHERGLKVHMDGARVFNAAAALRLPVREIVAPADTVMFCLSKALGAPVGSMLAGPATADRQGPALPQAAGRRDAPGGRAGGGGAGGAGGNAAETGGGPLQREVSGGRPGAHSRRPYRSGKGGHQHRNFRREWDGLAERGGKRATAGGGVLINGIDEGRMRAVTHYDVDREACAEALEALACAVLS